ncbi:MAG TPA: protein translocase subunit SecF [Rhizomicrobium sp.]|jgi:preprotein translocase subunit SecF|nr:protein translocase subunit SecF [Rhizomicrobium sp.]
MPWLRFIPETTNIDFVGWRYYAFAVDGLLVLISIISIALHGFNLGIDFTGGALIEAKAAQTIDVGTLRTRIAGLNFGETQINSVGGGECNTPKDSCVEIRIQPKADQSGNAIVQKVKSELGSGYKIRDSQVIGPKVSQELFTAGIIATLAAILLISVYVWFRFEWQYGIGALVATGHDVFVTAGLFSVLQMDFTLNTVAALLLLAGYSINDTVIVFDRIRENRRKYKRMGLSNLINLSTNQIATRTTLVSAATALSMIPLLFFGGPVLFNFSAAILFGILVGTFSSTYVAAALLLYLPAPAGSVDEAAAESA